MYVMVSFSTLFSFLLSTFLLLFFPAQTTLRAPGALAYATAATLGVLLMMLAAGWREAALLLAAGHAAFRVNQVLRAPNAMADAARLRAALGRAPWPRRVPTPLYRAAWALRRVDADFHLLNVLGVFAR